MSLDFADDIRDLLRRHIDASTGAALRKILHDNAVCDYYALHTPQEYIRFMNDNPCTFSINHPQSTNHPYYMTLFTVASQHVMGDCVEQCLDSAICAAKGRTK